MLRGALLVIAFCPWLLLATSKQKSYEQLEESFLQQALKSNPNWKNLDLSLEREAEPLQALALPYELSTSLDAVKPEFEGFPERSNARYTLGFGAQLPWGVSAQGEVVQEPSNSEETQRSFSLQVDLWPNLAGRQDRQRRHLQNLKLQEVILSAKSSALQLCMGLRESFWELALAKIRLDLKREKLKAAQEILSVVTKQYKRKQIRQLQYEGAVVDMEARRLELFDAQEAYANTLRVIEMNAEGWDSSSLKHVTLELFEERAQNDRLEVDTGLNSVSLEQDILKSRLEQLRESWRLQDSAYKPRVLAFYSYKDGDFSSLIQKENIVGLGLEWSFWSSEHRSQRRVHDIDRMMNANSRLNEKREFVISFEELKQRNSQQMERLKALRVQMLSRQEQLRIADQDLKFARMNVETYLNYRDAFDASQERYLEQLRRGVRVKAEIRMKMRRFEPLCGRNLPWTD